MTTTVAAAGALPRADTALESGLWRPAAADVAAPAVPFPFTPPPSLRPPSLLLPPPPPRPALVAELTEPNESRARSERDSIWDAASAAILLRASFSATVSAAAAVAAAADVVVAAAGVKASFDANPT